MNKLEEYLITLTYAEEKYNELLNNDDLDFMTITDLCYLKGVIDGIKEVLGL